MWCVGRSPAGDGNEDESGSENARLKGLLGEEAGPGPRPGTGVYANVHGCDQTGRGCACRGMRMG